MYEIILPLKYTKLQAQLLMPSMLLKELSVVQVRPLIFILLSVTLLIYKIRRL